MLDSVAVGSAALNHAVLNPAARCLSAASAPGELGAARKSPGPAAGPPVVRLYRSCSLVFTVQLTNRNILAHVYFRAPFDLRSIHAEKPMKHAAHIERNAANRPSVRGMRRAKSGVALGGD